jgi:Protein of unknown function (DUF3179)
MTRPATLWVVGVGALLVAAVVVGLPVWLIQPFAPQTPDAVAWSWQLRQQAPRITVAMTLLALAAAVPLWRRPAPPGWRAAVRRSSLVLVVTLTAATAWFARQNHFEWMFRPFPDPRFVVAAEATDVPADAPVLGVANGASALAFPITRIGYHHLVNATLGDVPIVATY